MGKFEKPLTWTLIIGILGYLFMGNCCKTECSTEVKKEIRVEVEDENLNRKPIVADTVIVNYLANDSITIDWVVDTNLEITEEEELKQIEEIENF
jgi:hypothetical protein